MRRSLALVATLALAGRAQAGVSLQGQLTATAGVTDNVTGAPNEQVAGQKGRQTDLIVTVNPGLILTAGGARAVTRLIYTFGGIIYARNTDADTYTNSVDWLGFFIPSKTTTMNLSLNVTQRRQSAFNVAADSLSTQTQVQPIGVTNLLTINAAQGLVWEITAKWRLVQTAGFGAAYIIDHPPPQPTFRSVPVQLDVERSFARDVLGVEVNATYTQFAAQRGALGAAGGLVEPDTTVLEQRSQIAVTPLARWRRDITYFLASHLELGSVVVFDPYTPSHKFVEPAGGAGLSYFSRLVNIDVGYSHSAQPNLLVASNFISDNAQLRALFLLGERSGFSLLLGGGYAYLRQLDLDAKVLGHAHTAAADVTLGYRPVEVLSFFLRYQLLYQKGDPTDPIPIASLYRNTLLFGLSAIYPGQSAADVPQANVGVRADRRDDPGITSSKSTPK